MSNLLRHAALAARRLLTFAGPALLVGFLAIPYTFAVPPPPYPKGQVGALERSIDFKLARITNDLSTASRVLQQQGRNSVAYRRSFQRLRIDFNNLVPRKDTQLQILLRRFGSRHQAQMFYTAATQREFDLTALLRKFLFTTPFQPGR